MAYLWHKNRIDSLSDGSIFRFRDLYRRFLLVPDVPSVLKTGSGK